MHVTSQKAYGDEARELFHGRVPVSADLGGYNRFVAQILMLSKKYRMVLESEQTLYTRK